MRGHLRVCETVAGQRFGHLVTIGDAEGPRGANGAVHRYAEYLCDCGNTAVMRFHQVRSGNTHDCGCGSWKRSRSHNMSRTVVYERWAGMLRRTKPGSRAFKNYAGRGIDVDPRWRSFTAFFEDMGEPPPGMTLERIDNNKGYSAENCKWADRIAQARNKRTTKMLTYKGETLPLVALAEAHGLSSNVVRLRIQLGWDIEKTLTHPVRRRKSAEEYQP